MYVKVICRRLVSAGEISHAVFRTRVR